MTRQHCHFVTGRLAERSLREVVEQVAAGGDFDYSIQVLPITVAALMSPPWIARRLEVPDKTTRVIVPGYCEGDLAPLQAAVGVPVDRGPRDLRQLPRFFGQQDTGREQYGDYDVQIIAEINNCPRLSLDEILSTAAHYAADGADLIDIGCDPAGAWPGVGECVTALREAGHRVSIDSLKPAEIAPAVEAGAELVLSVNSSNRESAADWGCEVVAIPDDPKTLAGLDETIDFLAARGVPLRIDPILEPIGFGFAESLGRYLETRRRYPDAEMMMGTGNLTELTDVDSAGVNVVLLGFCQEVGIRSVLTTEVIHWARSSVRECDLARRLVYYARLQQRLPKHIEPRLVMLRDTETLEHGQAELDELAAAIRDNNYRLFAERGEVHLLAAGLHLQDSDPFRLFAQLMATDPPNVNPGHAFYLGYEMAKAITALTLDKTYRQDEALDWGFLTREENHHRLPRKGSNRKR